MLRISLYSYLYLKLAKMLLLLLFLMLPLPQNWRRGQNRFCLEERGWGGEGVGGGERDGPNNVDTYK
jgi:hypothetical protein